MLSLVMKHYLLAYQVWIRCFSVFQWQSRNHISIKTAVPCDKYVRTLSMVKYYWVSHASKILIGYLAVESN
jgi:hypothetical protein